MRPVGNGSAIRAKTAKFPRRYCVSIAPVSRWWEFWWFLLKCRETGYYLRVRIREVPAVEV